jgi:hypothetical protein
VSLLPSFISLNDSFSRGLKKKDLVTAKALSSRKRREKKDRIELIRESQTGYE